MIKNILIGTVLVLLMMASAGATNGATVAVDPASQTVAAGDTFHVNVTVEGVVNLVADQAVLNFDPIPMQATDIIEGDFLTDVGGTIPVELLDNITGTATFSYSFTSAADKVSGTGTLATIQFSTPPDAPAGTYNLDLTGVILIGVDDAGQEYEIQTDLSNGTVTIEAAPTAPTPAVSVPVLSGIGMIVLTGMLAIVLAISVTKRRRE